MAAHRIADPALTADFTVFWTPVAHQSPMKRASRLLSPTSSNSRYEATRREEVRATFLAGNG
jgi:hypothetical protein